MKYTIVYIFLFISLIGCVTQERCAERFPPRSSTNDTTITIIKDSIRHDTVYIPGMELVFGADIPCPDAVFHKTETKGHLTGSVNIKKGKVTFKCAADSLQAIIEVKDRIITTLQSRNETVVTPPIPLPWWVPYAGWYFVITSPLLVAWSVWRVAKFR